MSLTIQDNSSGHAEEQNHKCLECVLGKKKKKNQLQILVGSSFGSS